MEKPTISVCIIAKNEAATLERTVKCVRELADEIVIGVDKSSSDGTQELAKRLATVYYEFEFKNNFSAARNYSMGKCKMDWIFILDAHEYITPDNIIKMERMWNKIPDESTGVGIKLLMEQDMSGVQMRFLKNRAGWKWKGAVHNQLNSAEVDKIDVNMGFTDVIIEHQPTKANRKIRKRQRYKMMKDIFTKEHAEKPKNVRPIFYLAQMAHETSKYKKALGYYKKYLKHTKDKVNGLERYLVQWQVGRCQQALGFSDKALHSMDKCINIRWDIPLAYATKAEIIHIKTKKWHEEMEAKRAAGEVVLRAHNDDFSQAVGEIEHLLKTAIKVSSIGIPDASVFYPLGYFTWLPWWKLADLYDDIGWYEQAIMCSNKVLSYNNTPPERRKEIELAIISFQNAIREDMLMDDADVEMGASSEGITIKPDMPKLVVFDNIGSFTNDIVKHFHEDGYTAVRNQEFVAGLAWWANVVWYEWCNQNIELGSLQDPIEAQVIVRIHGYEAFGGGSGENVEWDYVDDIIFVSQHVLELFTERYPKSKECRLHVVRNGLDMDKWTYKKREHGLTIGMAGYLKAGKNPALALNIMNRLPAKYYLKIVGEWQDAKLQDHFEWTVRNGLQGRVDVKRWHTDMNEWMDGIDYLISPSISESFSYVVAEAMAKGIKPIVYDRPEARDLWTNNLVFKTEQQAVDMILPDSPYNSKVYRKHVDKHFGLERQMYDIRKIFELGKRGNTKPKNPVRSENVTPKKQEAINA